MFDFILLKYHVLVYDKRYSKCFALQITCKSNKYNGIIGKLPKSD